MSKGPWGKDTAFPIRERSSRQRQQQRQRPEGRTVPSLPEEQGGGQREEEREARAGRDPAVQGLAAMGRTLAPTWALMGLTQSIMPVLVKQSEEMRQKLGDQDSEDGRR